MVEIDAVAKSEVINKWVMPDSLHLPISARDKNSIVKYIGNIILELSASNTDKAFLVHVEKPECLNTKLAVWNLSASKVLHQERQVWVHVDYGGYRRAYSKAFPDEDISSFDIDHIQNRKMASNMGFDYVRVIPVTKAANRSSGAVSEKWGTQYHDTEQMRKINREKKSFIQYADLSNLVKMLNIEAGGGEMDAVNEAQQLLLEN